MPQLDFTSFASQIFWLLITFGTLYFIMAKFALPGVREVLQNRQIRIDEDLKKAEKLKNEAQLAEADFTSAVISAKEKALGILADVRQKVASESEKRHAKLNETFVRQEKEAAQRIEIVKKEVAEEMHVVSVQLSVDIVKTLVGIDVDKDEVEKIMAS
jgi:F-type H+-transporting ATPase subunit b